MLPFEIGELALVLLMSKLLEADVIPLYTSDQTMIFLLPSYGYLKLKFQIAHHFGGCPGSLRSAVVPVGVHALLLIIYF